MLENSDTPPTPSDTLPRSTPEAQGIASGAIEAFVRAADAQVNSIHSFMLLRHGHVVAEGWWAPYAPETPHVMFSLSKSFTSTAVGLAIADGKMGLDDVALEHFADDAPPEPSANLKSMRVRDLLCMSTGHQTEPSLSASDAPWTQSFLAHPVPFKPGTHFLYNSPATYMLSAIVQKVTGQTVLDYLGPRLFAPLGIVNPTWGTSPQGVSLGGWGLNLRTEDIAKFGQLYLQGGRWHGQQLVLADWVAVATARQTSNGSNPDSDWDQGYGFQFWRCRHGAYRGDGAHGQFCVVLPEQDAVVAITAGTNDLQGVLNLVWEKLLPALEPSALPENAAAHQHLNETLSNLSMPRPAGSASPATDAGWGGREFHFPDNDRKLESVRVDSGTAGTTTLHLRVDGREAQVSCGHHHWIKGRLALGMFTDQPVAASGAWTDDGGYAARLCFYETAHSVLLTLRPAGDELHCTLAYHPGPASESPLVGHVA